MPTVAGFLPTTSGFHFSNWFPDVPLKTIPVPGLAHPIPIGHASNGLCGGMVYAVRDYFEAHQAPPPDQSAPGSGPLFEYLVNRLIESWDIPAGVLRYLALMEPGLPDFGGLLSGLDPAAPSRARIMINEEWPKVKSDIDNNHLSPLGLVKVKSTDPAQLGENHQVLAYGYDLRGTELTLRLYDPNVPDRDDVSLSLSIGSSQQSCSLECTTESPLFCFFRSNYTVKGPPPNGGPLPPR